MKSGMELFVAMMNSFYQWTIVTKISVVDVETVPPPFGNTQGLMIKLSSFLQALFSKYIVSNIIS